MAAFSSDESGWEVLNIPPEVQLSSKHKSDINKVAGEDKNKMEKESEEKLCGYMNKLGAIGIKTWKKRWFVFEPRRCTLYYYRTPDCVDPLGSIDIANSTFSLPTSPTQHKGQFEIRCADRVYQLQAVNKETMQFWLQQLKAERSKFMKLKCSMSGTQSQHTSVLSLTSGLLAADESNTDSNVGPDDLISFTEPVKRPSTVGEGAKSETSPQSFTNFSFGNMKKEFSNWRKSGIITGEPALNEARIESGENMDFGFAKVTAGLKRRTFWGGGSGQSTDDVFRTEFCRDCEEKRETLSILKEAIQIAEKEIKTRDEVIEHLHEQIRHAVMTIPEDSQRPKPDPDSIEERDKYIEQMSNMLRKERAENDKLKLRLDDKENRLLELKSKIEVLEEMLEKKDETIISLTNKIYIIENPDPASDVLNEGARTSTSSNQEIAIKEQWDSQDSEEICRAYKEKNKFLNSEILELFQMRKIDENIIKEKDSKIAALEAQCFKLRSRYIVLLKEFSTPMKDGGENRDPQLVQHLLDDAINSNPLEDSTTQQQQNKIDGVASKRASDRYGFYDVIDTEDEECLDVFADKLNEKSTDVFSNESKEISVGVRWENFLVAQGKRLILKTEDVKALVRAGIPHEFRARVWQDLINHYVYREREIAGPGYYKSLLEEKRGAFTPDAKQIEVDLLRTLPNNKFYENIDSKGTSKLRNVLLAFSWHNTAVGYCQGLNRLGAIALLYLEEEDAFWCLIAIVEHLMPRDYYTRTLIGAQIDQRVFKELFDEKLPKLSALFQNLQIDLSLLSFNWFLAIFIDIFPIELILRVWDTFLYEGNKVLFRYSLAIFKSCEEDLLKFRDSGQVFAFFRRLPSSRTNPHRISQIAFQQMNPFPKRNILTKRANYKPKIEAELAEFEAMRQDRKSVRDKNKNSEIFSDDDD
eukprot:gene12310-13580_t